MNEVERWTYDATEQQAESVRLRQQVASLEARLAATVEAGSLLDGVECVIEYTPAMIEAHNEAVCQAAQGGAGR